MWLHCTGSCTQPAVMTGRPASTGSGLPGSARSQRGCIRPAEATPWEEQGSCLTRVTRVPGALQQRLPTCPFLSSLGPSRAARAHVHPAGLPPVPVGLGSVSVTSWHRVLVIPQGRAGSDLPLFKVSSGPDVRSAERYDPLTGTWTSIAAMSTRRRYVRVAMLGG